MFTVAFLRECFDADPTTGLITWKTRPPAHFASGLARSNTRFAGKEAGTVNAKGYRVITILAGEKGRKLLAHRVMWAIHFGAWPNWQLDHINRNRLDNRIENLRDVSHAENMRNRSVPVASPQAGVSLRPSGNFIAFIGGGGRQKYLGTFPTLALAAAARAGAESRREAA